MSFLAPRSGTRPRPALTLLCLEDRLTPAGYSFPIGLQPDQIRQAYGIDSIKFNGVIGDGTGQTIAIVDAYDNPSIAADLATFDSTFGSVTNQLDARPVSQFFTKVNQRGGATPPNPDTAPGSGWSTEIALDVEWAHAVAPMANILLVEADSSANTDLFAAVRYAATQPGVTVVSNSYGSSEYASEFSIDSTFFQSGVSFVVSAGDSGRIETPSSSPNVLSVGGTLLTLSPTTGNWQAEVGWSYATSSDSGGGGGVSTYQLRPGFQDGVANVVGTHRGTPDVAYNGDPASGVAVIDSFGNGAATPWAQIGGTSAGAPQWAALLAVTNQGRALNGLTPLNTIGDTLTLPAIYGLKAGYFHDIRTGTNFYGQKARAGYDLLTGRGTPIADQLVPKLAGYLTASTVTVNAAPTAVRGGAVTLTATVGGNTIEGTPTGAVRFTAGGVDLGTVVLVNGVATLTTSILPAVGPNVVTATYLGDANYQTAGGTTTVGVTPANTTTTVAVTPSNPLGDTYGDSATLKATVAPVGPGATPTGTVTFQVGSLVLGTVPLVNGVATLTTTALPAGAADLVSAVYSGNATYTTGLGSKTIAVAQAALTVSADDQTKVYGAANPAFTLTTLGTLVNGDTLATALTGSPATTATAASGVGTYDITQGTLTSANYAVTFVPGTLTVTPAQLTLTTDDQTKVYGDPTPVLTYTVTGFVNGDTAATALTGALGAIDPALGVGSYPIDDLGTLAAANYDITLVPGTLTVTPALLTLTADDQTKVYGAPTPALTYTPVGLVNGDTLATALAGAAGTTATAASGVGTYDINQGTLTVANYDIVFVDGTLTVTPAKLTLKAVDTARAYGSQNPSFALAPTGLVNGDTVATAVTGAASSAATAASGIGSYPITRGTLAAANYDVTFAPGTLTVTPAPLTLTAGDQRRPYGAAVSDLAVTPTGLVNGDTLATAVTGTVGTTATQGSPIGLYPVTRGSLAAGPNYAVTFVGGTLTIDPAVLTLTADDQTKVYGSANPALTYTASGFVNGDTAGRLTGAAATAAAAGSGAGTYAITQGSLAANNYTIAFAPGTLTVTPAPLTVAADPQTKVYGAAVPALTYTATGLVNGDTAAGVLAGGFATTATAASGVGSYPITPAGLTTANPNYALTVVPATLTVAPAPLTVSVDDATRGVRQANPAFTPRVSGLVNGDTLAALSGTLAVTTAAGPDSLPGGYPIVPGGLSSPNYAVTFAPGTLTIGKVHYYAAVDGTGPTTRITVYRPDGSVATTFPAFEPSFSGGASVAVGDVNGDGVDDIVIGAGSGGGPRVRVYSGADFLVLTDFFAYEETFRGGVNVAVADINGDGSADIVTGAGDQGGPAVREFSGKDYALLASFFAYDSNFRNGVTVAAADIDGDGRVEIVTGAGAGGGPVVKVFDGRTSAPLAVVMAFDSSYRNGVTVGAGPGYVAVGTGPGTASAVQVRDGAELTKVRSEFFPFDPSYTGGVSLEAATDDHLLVFPTSPTGPTAGLWDPLAGTFLGGIAVA